MSAYGKIWRDLQNETHAHGFVYRRALPKCPHDIFLGRQKPSNRRQVDISISGAKVGEPVVNNLSSDGIQLSVHYKSSDSASLSLVELTESDSPQFDDLLEDLLETLQSRPGDGAVGRLISRTKAWFRFFALTSSELGTDQSAGLYAELYILRALLEAGLPPNKAVQSWEAPSGSPQDFYFRNGALEVKSDRTKGPGKLNINSELQLDRSTVGNILVVLLQLDQRSTGEGETLTQIADRCLVLLDGDTEATHEFKSRLLSSGLDVNDSNSPHRFSVRAQRFFNVTSDFPCLTQSALPIAISNLRYTIDCATLEKFEVSLDQAFATLGVLHGE